VRASAIPGLGLGLGLGVLVAASLPACADAPITPEHLEPDGQLKPVRSGGSSSAYAATLQVDRSAPKKASVVQFDAVLAAAPNGTLEDVSTFPPDVGTVHLHVRAHGLETDRDVVFRWTHGEHSLTVPGELAPASQFVLAASIDVQPDQIGPWRIEIVGEPTHADEAPEVLFAREFLILSERPSE
jgi:hypothetical protein